MSGGTNTGGPVLGLDLGSRSVKHCLMDGGRVVRTGTLDTMKFYRTCGTHAAEGFRVDFSAFDITENVAVAATGYGRSAAALTGAGTVSELTAHAAGAVYQTGRKHFILVDIGGQDYKVMRIEDGRIVDMATNDKCAASTGRYLENMARVLDINIGDLGQYGDEPVDLSATCAIFGESELIGHVVRGEPLARLAAGVNTAVVNRIVPLINRMGEGPVVMSGGVALNGAVVSILGRAAGRPVDVVADPVHNGAIGCCVRYGAATGSGK